MLELTIKEVAQCLNLPTKKIERWIRQGRIPIYQKGSDCTFKRSVLEKWAAKHDLRFRLPEKPVGQDSAPGEEGLLAAMRRGGVLYNVAGDTPETVLEAAVNGMGGITPDTRELLYDRLMEREALISTGIGRGIAIPHPRSPLAGYPALSQITTCFPKTPIDFNAIDDQPVFVLFILLSPSIKSHLHLLSRLAYCLRDDSFTTFLRTHPDPDRLFSATGAVEKQLDRSENQ